MRKYNINANPVRAIEHLCGNAISAVKMKRRKNGSEQQLELGKGVFSHPFFLIYFERIMSDVLEKNVMER